MRAGPRSTSAGYVHAARDQHVLLAMVAEGAVMRRRLNLVIPAKAGIQTIRVERTVMPEWAGFPLSRE
jgi:hypothetical protein